MIDLLPVIERALDGGISPLGAAMKAWDKSRGTRVGFHDALLGLIDEGALVGQVVGKRGGKRRILKIHGVKQAVNTMNATSTSVDKRVVFVVHGRDEDLRQSLYSFLRSIHLLPIEWSELTSSAASAAPHIPDLLDAAFQRAQAVVVLLSPDEDVKLTDRLGGGDEGFQPRPNVLFESGLAFARNADRTVLVEVGKVRPFSDIAGRHVVRLDDTSSAAVAKRQDLAMRLKAAGCDVSITGTDWHTAGSFRIVP
jgi:predicted nucleotide-binding protein